MFRLIVAGAVPSFKRLTRHCSNMAGVISVRGLGYRLLKHRLSEASVSSPLLWWDNAQGLYSFSMNSCSVFGLLIPLRAVGSIPLLMLFNTSRAFSRACAADMTSTFPRSMRLPLLYWQM